MGSTILAGADKPPRLMRCTHVLSPILPAIALLLVGAAVNGAFAQDYPSRTIRFLVPFPAGSSTDFISRLVAEDLRNELGQSVVVENRAGAAGMIATEMLARSPADGYTLAIGNEGTHVSAVAIKRAVPYDPMRDFSPITLATRTTMGIAINTRVIPANSVNELIAYLKAHPGNISYGTSGVGTPQFFVGEMLKQRAGIEMIHVPYPGAGAAANDLLGGNIGIVISTLPAIASLRHTDPIKLLAIGDPERNPDLPDVPTVAETLPDFTFAGWNGFFGPAHLPPAIVRRLNEIMVRTIRSPEFAARIRSQYIVPVGSSPDELSIVVHDGIEQWKKVVAASGLQAQ
jgi:tripartite-type tricarboxylate transporter receptor subunit TctC